MPKPIRVLQVFAEMNTGGAETMIMNIYRHIDRDKIQFDFIVHTEEKCTFDDEIERLGGRIYRVPRYVVRNHNVYLKAWKNFFENHLEYKIIHGHVRSTAAIYLWVAKKYKLTTIAHSHNTSSGKGVSAIAKNILQYPISNIADYLLACSITAGVWLFGEKAVLKDNFRIVNNAIHANDFKFSDDIRTLKRAELGLDEKFVIGHVGRFHAQKNHDFLIDIFKEFHDINRNSTLLLVGDGELRKSISDKVDDLNLSDSVIFTGIRQDVPELFQAMDVLVFPSLFEGLPVTLIEAQATGLKSVISDQITKEVDLTDLIVFQPLVSSAKGWAKVIDSVKIENYGNRKQYYKKIKDVGFDIGNTSESLQELYFYLMGEDIK